MRQLFTPWRMKYIQKARRVRGCVFCNEIKLEDGPANLIIHRAEKSFVILNRYPYSTGHLMVLPYLHKPSLEYLDAETRAEMMELVNQALVVLRFIYHPAGFNIGVNIGEPAGAGVVGHVHIHVLPRWSGDTNFMTAVTETRVLPETLDTTYRRVLGAWEKLTHAQDE